MLNISEFPRIKKVKGWEDYNFLLSKIVSGGEKLYRITYGDLFTPAMVPLLSGGTDGQLIIGQTGANSVYKTIVGDAAMDAAGTLTITNDAITFAKFQNINTLRLLGRTTALAGDTEEISVGAGLSLAALTLACTITQYTDEMAQDAIGGILTDTNSIDFTYDDAGNIISAIIKKQNSATINLTVPDANGLKAEFVSMNISQFVNDSGYLTSVTPHDLLSVTHSDTLAAGVLRGSIITGNLTPKWSALALGTSGKILRSDGTDLLYSTATFADTYAASEILYSNGANVVQGLATANNGILITSGAGVPSIASTLPDAVQDNITRLGTIASITTPLGAAYGGNGQSFYAVGDLLYASAVTTLSKLADVATGSVLISGGVGVAPAWSASPTLTTSLTCPVIYGSSSAGGALTLYANSTATTGNIIFNIGSTTNVARFLSTGEFLIGRTTSSAANIKLQFAGGSSSTYCEIASFSATDGHSPGLIFQKSSSATIGTKTVTANGEALGIIIFSGINSANIIAYGAYIYGIQDGVAGATYIPGRIEFRTATAVAGPTERWRIENGGNLSNTGASGTAYFHLKAGTATASTSPLKLTSGTSLTVAEAGAIEFTTDDLFFTITTGAARKGIILNNGTNLILGRIPVATTNGRLLDYSTLLYDGSYLQSNGYKSADGSAGVSGTWTTVDGKTITAKDGIITSIV